MDKQAQSKVGKSNVRRSKSHERTIAKFLTEWSGREFRRRRVEGRDVTVIERESTADVIPVKGQIHCSIEAKCGEVQTFGALLSNPLTCKLTQWWHQVSYDASLLQGVFNRKFYPMLFFRPYSNQNWVAVSYKLFSESILKPKSGSAVKPVWFNHLLFDGYESVGEVGFNVVRTKNKNNFRIVPLMLDAMVMCHWQDFANHVDPNSFFVNE